MACRDGGPSDEEIAKARQERLDLVTRVACTAMAFIDEKALLLNLGSAEAVNWWKKHKEADRKRKKNEAADKYRSDVTQATAKLRLAVDAADGKAVKIARKKLDELLDQVGWES